MNISLYELWLLRHNTVQIVLTGVALGMILSELVVLVLA